MPLVKEKTMDLRSFLNDSLPEALALLEELCLIPAPSGQEDKRAAFVKNWLEENGAAGVYTDNVKVINCTYTVAGVLQAELPLYNYVK